VRVVERFRPLCVVLPLYRPLCFVRPLVPQNHRKVAIPPTLKTTKLLDGTRSYGIHQWFFAGGGPSQEGVNKFPEGREPLRALQHGKFYQYIYQ